MIFPAPNCASVTLYGLVPPVIDSFHGSQVSKFPVMLEVMRGVEAVGSGMRQEVSLPAGAAGSKGEVIFLKQAISSNLPTLLKNDVGNPPVCPMLSTTVSRSSAPR